LAEESRFLMFWGLKRACFIAFGIAVGHLFARVPELAEVTSARDNLLRLRGLFDVVKLKLADSRGLSA
jgi:hypothetical protein